MSDLYRPRALVFRIVPLKRKMQSVFLATDEQFEAMAKTLRMVCYPTGTLLDLFTLDSLSEPVCEDFEPI